MGFNKFHPHAVWITQCQNGLAEALTWVFGRNAAVVLSSFPPVERTGWHRERDGGWFPRTQLRQRSAKPRKERENCAGRADHVAAGMRKGLVGPAGLPRLLRWSKAA
jgi:hypothetical protein